MNAPDRSLPDAADWFVILKSARVFVKFPIDRTLMLMFRFDSFMSESAASSSDMCPLGATPAGPHLGDAGTVAVPHDFRFDSMMMAIATYMYM